MSLSVVWGHVYWVRHLSCILSQAKWDFVRHLRINTCLSVLPIAIPRWLKSHLWDAISEQCWGLLYQRCQLQVRCTAVGLPTSSNCRKSQPCGLAKLQAKRTPPSTLNPITIIMDMVRLTLPILSCQAALPCTVKQPSHFTPWGGYISAQRESNHCVFCTLWTPAARQSLQRAPVIIFLICSIIQPMKSY